MALRRLELETELRTPWLGRSPRERNGYPLQYSCLENPMDRGAWQVTVHGVAESDMTAQLSTRAYNYMKVL